MRGALLLIGCGVVLAWPVLAGGYATYVDNPVHLAEIDALAVRRGVDRRGCLRAAPGAPALPPGAIPRRARCWPPPACFGRWPPWISVLGVLAAGALVLRSR